MAWKVWGHPTALTIGFQRAVVVEELDPDLVASVEATQDIYNRPATRYDRTIRYFALVAFGGSRTASKAADVLVKVHSKAVGIEPYGGKVYDANDPDSQLWILLTGWHSVLYAYERYGPGKLTPEQDRQFWAECAVAAELQTCDPADVPQDRAGLREYYAKMRPQLSGSPLARKAMNHLLRGEVALPPMPRTLRPFAVLATRVMRRATIATMPRWMREMSGLRQSRLTDTLVRPVMRLAFAIAHRSPELSVRLLKLMSPSTVPVAGPMLRGLAPLSAEILSPAEARERYGYDRPRDAHLALRQKQLDKALAGQRTSDEGIVESEPILGRTG
ncbi:DUF2236 domain-containing protein [Pseudonocardiaceae bacterium YIM PH 21723]|nr:DUF2236 domain-containing protein [Pseudonocardiaceae bacterium YIM PH 21723]